MNNQEKNRSLEKTLFKLTPIKILRAFCPSSYITKSIAYRMTPKESEELGKEIISLPLNEWKLYRSPKLGFGGDGEAFTIYNGRLIKVERTCKRDSRNNYVTTAKYILLMRGHGFLAFSFRDNYWEEGVEQKVYEHIVEARRTELEQLEEQRIRRLRERSNKTNH